VIARLRNVRDALLIILWGLCSCTFSREAEKKTTTDVQLEVQKHEAPRDVITYRFREGARARPGRARAAPAPELADGAGYEGAELESVTVERVGAVDTSTKKEEHVSTWEKMKSKTTAAIPLLRIAAVLVALAVGALYLWKRFRI
jgi:hypothetical protein